jgi:hypothetical protein
VIVETPDPLEIVTLRGEALEAARSGYPGYLEVRPEMYAAAWTAVASRLDEL